MKLFRPRGQNDAGQLTRSPLGQVAALYEAGRYAEAEAEARAVAEARARAAAAHDACLAAFGPDHHRTAEARALLDRIDGP
jgi:hypothetical protein